MGNKSLHALGKIVGKKWVNFGKNTKFSRNFPMIFPSAVVAGRGEGLLNHCVKHNKSTFTYKYEYGLMHLQYNIQ